MLLREDQIQQARNQAPKKQPQQQPSSKLDQFVQNVRRRQTTGQGAPTAPPPEKKTPDVYDFSKTTYKNYTPSQIQQQSKQETAQKRYESVKLTALRSKYQRLPSNTRFTDEQGNQYSKQQVLQSIDRARVQQNRPGREYQLGKTVGSPVSSWDPESRIAYNTRTGEYSPVFPYEGAQYYKEYKSMVNTRENLSGVPVAYVLGGGEGWEGLVPIVGPAVSLASANEEERIRKQIRYIHHLKGSPTGGPTWTGAGMAIIENPQVQWAATAGILKGGSFFAKGLIRGTRYTKPLLQAGSERASQLSTSTVGKKIVDIGKSVTNKLKIKDSTIFKNVKLYEKGYTPGKSLVEVQTKVTTKGGMTLQKMKYITDETSKRIFISPEQTAKYQTMLKSGGRLDIGFPKANIKYGVGKLEMVAEGTISRSRLGRVYAYSVKELKVGEKVTASIKNVPVKQSFSEIESVTTKKVIPKVVQTSEKIPGKIELRSMLQKGYRRTITLESGKEQIISGEKGLGKSKMYLPAGSEGKVRPTKNWIARLEKKADITYRKKGFLWNEFGTQTIQKPETITIPKKTTSIPTETGGRVRINVPSRNVIGEIGGQITTPVFIRTTIEGTKNKREMERIKVPESIQERRVSSIQFNASMSKQNTRQDTRTRQDVRYDQKTIQIQTPIQKTIHPPVPRQTQSYKTTTPTIPVIWFPKTDLFGRGIREYGYKQPSDLEYKFRKANIKLPFSDLKTPRFKI